MKKYKKDIHPSSQPNQVSDRQEPYLSNSSQQYSYEGGIMSKLSVIKQGLPYDAIEGLSARLHVPVKSVLQYFDLAQTTYNKKKRDEERMTRRETETLLFLNELVDYGLGVFNGEEVKFQRWLHKPNISLGGAIPEVLLDSITGIQEVHRCLERIEYGNVA
jgi:putative toxin-antitoxin system antitoxin component (TIGR02293 family)